jgi:very-short-patch-repair endonuclease
MTKALRANSGVISLKHLHLLGFSKDEVAAQLARGDLKRLHWGVFVDGRGPLVDQAYLKAALLAVGQGPWLSGKTAAAVWGLTPLSVARIEIGVVATSTPRHKGLKVVRAARAPHRSELRSRRGMRVSSVSRMLVEVALDATSEELNELIETAVRLECLDLAELELTLTRHDRRPGIGRLKQALVAYRPAPRRESGLERAFDRWLLAHPEIPEPQRNVRLGRWELDCYWPEYQLVLELDGRPYHVVATDIERDRLKDAWLQRAGLRILRVTDRRWKADRSGAHSDLLALLALGGHATLGDFLGRGTSKSPRVEHEECGRPPAPQPPAPQQREGTP